jgi:hypothetical protein
MKDMAEVFEIVAAEAHADVFGDGVADRIGMAEPFAFDDLNLL